MGWVQKECGKLSGTFGRKMPENPYLSFVCVSRNDNHGGDPLARLVYSCRNFIKQSAKYRTPTEFVIVEWNPPKDRPRLKQELKSIVRTTSNTQVRIITVPEEVHQKFEFSEKLPLFQMIGKNVGIRRSRGKFVLSSNIDILLGDKLFVELLPGKLREQTLYRSTRLDLKNDILREEFQEMNAVRHATRLNHMPNTIQLGSGAEILVNYHHSSTPSTKKQFRKIFFHRILTRIKRIFNKRHKNNFPLHTNACGDFQLMDRDSWHRVGGYSEMNLYSFHIDSLLMYSALANGIFSVVFPSPLYHYHIDHTQGWVPENPDLLFNRLRNEKIGFLDQEVAIFEELYRRGEMAQTEFLKNWGLPSYEFEEQIL